MESNPKIKIKSFLSLSCILLGAAFTFGQCKPQIEINSTFSLNLTRGGTFVVPSAPLRSIQPEYEGAFVFQTDTVLVFSGDELYTQAVLEIKQDIFALNNPAEFDEMSTSFQLLKESRSIEIKKTENKLIIIDCGPKTEQKNTEIPLELFCFDFKSKKTLIINSSSQVIEWDTHLAQISQKSAKKIVRMLL